MSELVGTILQVAEALETTDDSIRWLKKNRGLPHVYINRKEWRVPWDALKEWLAAEVARNAANTQEPEPESPDEVVDGTLLMPVSASSAG